MKQKPPTAELGPSPKDVLSVREETPRERGGRRALLPAVQEFNIMFAW